MWNLLGMIAPSEQMWLPFTSTQSSGAVFRVTYFSSRNLEYIGSFGWLAYRCVGGADPMPPTMAIRLYPDIRNRMLYLPFPDELLSLGYNRRIFEIKRSAKSMMWQVQLEEFIP